MSCTWSLYENLKFATINIMLATGLLYIFLPSWGISCLFIVFWELLSWKGIQFHQMPFVSIVIIYEEIIAMSPVYQFIPSCFYINPLEKKLNGRVRKGYS